MRKILRKHLPKPDALHEHRYLRAFAPSLLHPRLWHLNRHSAAGGVAVGLFCSLIPGPLQMLGAALMCMYFRVNLPLALVGTWLSNPLTIVPLYLAAITLGGLIVGGSAEMSAPPEINWQSPAASTQAWLEWVLALGTPLLIGLPVLALLLAAAGFFCTRFSWEYWLRRSWQQRRISRYKKYSPKASGKQ